MEKTMKMGRFSPLTQEEMFAVNGGENQAAVQLAESLRAEALMVLLTTGNKVAAQAILEQAKVWKAIANNTY
ncbi:MAG: hypothetical protein LBS85_04225 [Clostridiales Family XIII bacterium]|jgi:acetylglutamate kinase|nr:hypothetical protein [Clostridiales Family XIII bacterium]